jgi:AcrR family transcriptional regulator
MTDTPGRRADTTRQQLLRAAAHQFASRAYQDVGLDDILAEAELTKGAMYFHFPSKHALALAIIEKRGAADTVTVQDLLARKLSGLETLVGFCYQLAIQDISQDESKAALLLLGSLHQTDGPQARLLSGWIETLAFVAKRAIAEGDVTEQTSPEDLGLVIVSLYLGMRLTSNLDESQQFLLDLEKNLVLVLRGFVPPDRFDYFRQFIRRRTALAIGAMSTRQDSD